MLSHIAFIVVLIVYSTAQTCPNNWVQEGTNCYYFVTTELTWFDADQYCTYLLPGTFKVHLTSVESINEHQALKRVIDNEPALRTRDFWTSGNKIDNYVGWKWSSVNRAITYSIWAPGEPNDSGNCIQMWSDEQHYWDDAPCAAEVNFICKIPANETLAGLENNY